MKILFVLMLLLIILNSCSTVENDCMCTMEFRAYLVTVINSAGVPIDSLSLLIRDKDGNELNVEQTYFPYSGGMYTVLTDSFTKMFCSCGTPEKIYFTATDGTRTASAEYLFNTDECKCHINKVSGPDTLVIG